MGGVKTLSYVCVSMQVCQTRFDRTRGLTASKFVSSFTDSIEITIAHHHIISHCLQVILLALCLQEATSRTNRSNTHITRGSSTLLHSRQTLSLDRRSHAADAGGDGGIPSHGNRDDGGISLLNHIEWRQNLSEGCRNATSLVWDGE